MSKQTFADRLKIVMEQKNISPTDLERISGVTRQAITYIINNNLSKSKLSLPIALALNISHDWLANGVNDKSFIINYELLVFNDIYLLISYLMSDNKPNIVEKSTSHNNLLKTNGFVFNPVNSKIYYYCSKNQKIKSSQYLELSPQNNKFEVINKASNTPFCFPIIEIKNVLVDRE
ncbi:helix-turn-helix domain-containing protein [Rickettsiales bacterium LUAb2]